MPVRFEMAAMGSKGYLTTFRRKDQCSVFQLALISITGLSWRHWISIFSYFQTTVTIETSQSGGEIQKSASSSNTTYVLQKSYSKTELAGPEIAAPIFPVEIKHGFPSPVPGREEAPGKDDLKFPVLGVDGKHQYKAPTPKTEADKKLSQPVFDVDRAHS